MYNASWYVATPPSSQQPSSARVRGNNVAAARFELPEEISVAVVIFIDSET